MQGSFVAFRDRAAKTRAGEVIVSNSHGPESLAEVVSELGPHAKACTRQEAAQADVVVVAVRWPELRARSRR